MQHATLPLVEQLESGELSLEEALKQFERGVKLTRECQTALKEAEQKVEILVNRMGLADTDISLNKALETIGREVFWQLPNDYATMVGSRNNGIPLSRFAPKARLTRSIMDLTRRLKMGDDEHAAAEAAPRKRGLFGLFGGK